MKKLFLVYIISLFACNVLVAQTFIGGAIYQDLNLTSEDSPFIVTENLIITDTVVLTIEPGVEVLFEEGTAFKSRGAIVADGNEDHSIVFRARPQTADSWTGITLLQQDQFDTVADVFRHCEFSGVNSTVIVSYRRNDLVVENSLFYDNPNFSIKLFDNINTQIRNNEIREGGYGVYISSNSISENMLVDNNTLDNLSSVAIIIFGQDGYTANNVFRHNTISNCLYGIQVRGGEKTSNNLFEDNVIYSNEVGLLVFNGYNLIRSNKIFENHRGVNLVGNEVSGGQHNEICKNILFDNVEAIRLEELSADNVLDSNLIFRNSIGIKLYAQTVHDKANTITHNTLYQNDSSSLILNDSPQDLIAFNNFTDLPSPYFFLLNEEDQLATHNWWGTTDTLLIDKNIFDVNDSPDMGEVIYQPILEQPSVSMIAPPRHPIKQLVDDTLLVRWDRALSDNVAGYKVYYKAKNAFQFLEVFDAGDTNLIKIPEGDILEEIAITSYKEDADGYDDQLEFNESWFVMAEMYPFAGRHLFGCEGSILDFHNATAFEFDSLKWITTGSGNLLDDNMVNAGYMHSDEDLNDTVWFWVQQFDSIVVKSDSIPVYFSALPEVDAGKDTAIIADSVFRIETAIANHVDTVRWQSLGDGEFLFADSVAAVYTPGVADKESGEVELIISGIAKCGGQQDTLKVRILPSFSLFGRVNYEGIPDGEVMVFTDAIGYFRNMNSQALEPEKEFVFPGVPMASGYLLYIPDDESTYLPTYYVNKTRWEKAYELQVDANTYDLDIHPQHPPYQLPAGEGAVSGQVQLEGSRNSGICIIHLTDTAANVLKWDVPDEFFRYDFKQLPYGSYRLAVESVGIPYFITQTFTLSAENPSIENLNVIIDDKESFIALPSPKSPVQVYPNFFSERLSLLFKSNHSRMKLSVFTLDGRQVYHKEFRDITAGLIRNLNLNHLESGIYLLRIDSDGKRVSTEKIIKN